MNHDKQSDPAPSTDLHNPHAVRNFVTVPVGDEVVSVPAGIWTGVATIATLFLLQATRPNPYEFYFNLRWITLIACVFGIFITFRFERFGWTCLLMAIASVFEFATLERSTWVVLDCISAIVMFAGGILLRWDIHDRTLLRTRDVIDMAVLISTGVIVLGISVHVAISVALLPLSYLISGDEEILGSWNTFRDEHFGVIAFATCAIVAGVWFNGWRMTRVKATVGSSH